LSIDMDRVNSLREPIFARENGYMGSMIRYDGLGYKIGLEKDASTGYISQSQMIMFGNVIVAAIASKENNDKKLISISQDIIEKLSATKKIIIKNKTSETENPVSSTISDITVIKEIMEIMASAEQYGDDFHCDRHGFDFEMYDDKENIIDTIYVWTGKDERIMPASIHSGCSYYNVTSNNSSLSSIIENETGYKFYTIYDYTGNCDQAMELIYEDDDYKYYFSCLKSDKVFIEFLTNGLKITVKKALKDNYITINELVNTHPTLFSKQAN
ncbi:MAG: hypothetical protein PHY00_04145, partial [Bacilli bacterium]|nr:hypothetical protein [Bacilli bacterium]